MHHNDKWYYKIKKKNHKILKPNVAKCLFFDMMDQGVQPDVVCFNMLIDGLCKNWRMDEANRLAELMIQRGVNPDTSTCNALMDGFCLADRFDRARELLVSMGSKGCKQDAFSHSILINGGSARIRK